MNKFSGGHNPNAVPTNLFATWEVDRSSPHCIPRVCSLALGKLIVMRELDRDVQSVFLAVKMQGSKRVLRSNEICLLTGGLLNTDLELTFTLQYPHFIKRDGNILQVMLQRKKRYKNRAMLGYKTLAIGTLDMAQIIQSPIIEESSLELISTNKDRRNSTMVSSQVIVLSAYSTPSDEVDVGIERTGKQLEADRSPDVDNYTDDEETFSSDAEIGSDVNPRELFLDEDGSQKRKERRKLRMSSSSRQQNFIKAKLIALLRKFKQAADEGLGPDMVQDHDASVPDAEDLDFLYNEIEELNFSDSCPEVEDNISIVSTPKPKLRPYFDRTSHSSSQTEISSLRDHYSAEYIPICYGPDSREGTLRHHNQGARETFEDLRTCDTTLAIDQSDSTDKEDDLKEQHFGQQPVAETGCHTEWPFPQQPSSVLEDKQKLWPRPNSQTFQKTESKMNEKTISAEEINMQASLQVLYGTFPLEEDDAEVSQASSACPLILMDWSEKNARRLAEAFQSYISEGNSMDAVLIATTQHEQLGSVFSSLITKVQKFINSNSQQPTRVKIVVAGTECYINRILQQFVDFLSSRSPEWMTFFLFLVVPLGKNKLGQYLASLDNRYAKLFNDQAWREMFDKPVVTAKPITPTSSNLTESYSGTLGFDVQLVTEISLVHRVLEYVNQASSTLLLSIAEAMLTFGEKSGNEDSAQKFVPFISEAKVGANEFLTHPDSDKEDIYSPMQCISASNGGSVASTSANPLGSPFNPASAAPTSGTMLHANQPVPVEPKMGLQVDYWKDRDSVKYTLKTTFKYFLVSQLPTLGERSSSGGLALDVVTVGKKNIMRLPGKKGKEKEAEPRSQIISNINRIICTSKHQHNLLKVKVDGIEWTEVKFFQLSSHWSSHVKTFPVGLFPSH